MQRVTLQDKQQRFLVDSFSVDFFWLCISSPGLYQGELDRVIALKSVIEDEARAQAAERDASPMPAKEAISEEL